MTWYSVDGSPVHAGGLTITPRSHVLSARFGLGAFVWQTPTSVLVEGGGPAHRLRIVDVTLIAQVALLIFAALFLGRLR